MAGPRRSNWDTGGTGLRFGRGRLLPGTHPTKSTRGPGAAAGADPRGAAELVVSTTVGHHAPVDINRIG